MKTYDLEDPERPVDGLTDSQEICRLCDVVVLRNIQIKYLEMALRALREGRSEEYPSEMTDHSGIEAEVLMETERVRRLFPVDDPRFARLDVALRDWHKSFRYPIRDEDT